MTMFQKFLKDEDGATMIEYGLIAALVAVALIGGLQALQGELTETFTAVENALDGAQGN